MYGFKLRQAASLTLPNPSLQDVPYSFVWIHSGALSWMLQKLDTVLLFKSPRQIVTCTFHPMTRIIILL